MTEPTAEHLKDAQEWLSMHDGFCLRTDDLNRADHTAASALAALLASREQALREENERLRGELPEAEEPKPPECHCTGDGHKPDCEFWMSLAEEPKRLPTASEHEPRPSPRHTRDCIETHNISEGTAGCTCGLEP